MSCTELKAEFYHLTDLQSNDWQVHKIPVFVYIIMWRSSTENTEATKTLKFNVLNTLPLFNFYNTF